MDYATGFVKARGAIPVVRLHDVPNRVREVALHAVHHGAVVALAVAQVRFGHEFQLLPHGFLATDHPEDHEGLIDDFFNARCFIALSSPGRDIVNKEFFCP